MDRSVHISTIEMITKVSLLRDTGDASIAVP